MNINDLSTDQILQIIVLKKKIEKLHTAVEKRVEKLQSKIDSIAGDGATPSPSTKLKKRRMSRAGRAAIGASAKARWAKYRGNGVAAKGSKKPAKKRRKMSAAARAKFSEIAKARWAKAKKAGKTTL